jgi:hypothetical protein
MPGLGLLDKFGPVPKKPEKVTVPPSSPHESKSKKIRKSLKEKSAGKKNNIKLVQDLLQELPGTK